MTARVAGGISRGSIGPIFAAALLRALGLEGDEMARGDVSQTVGLRRHVVEWIRLTKEARMSEDRTLDVETAVVGAGLAGLAAATVAAGEGVSVALLDVRSAGGRAGVINVTAMCSTKDHTRCIARVRGRPCSAGLV